MKVLVLGPSGSGKTYIAHALNKEGINTFDADEIKDLSAWYKDGKKVAAPVTAKEATDNHYAFLWSREFLEDFLVQFKDVYIFGGSGNVFNIIDLFDKVFFLKIDPLTQKKRLLISRKNSVVDFNDDELVIWGAWFEQEVKKRKIAIVDAALSPNEIFNIINKG